MKLAACYIVKNEAEDLRKSLESVKDAVDEIVVVDTGSRDDTVEIARSFGAKVSFYQWNDHFADARNFALEQVESPWVIFLDADEAFLHPEEVRQTLEEYWRKYPDGYAFTVIRYDVDQTGQKQSGGHGINLRIFRNMPELRYQGRIHECLGRTDSNPLELIPTDERLAISHTGYSSDRSKAKALRNLELLKKDVEDAGGIADPSQNGYLSDVYYVLGEYRKSLECALLALDSEARFFGLRGSRYHAALESMRKLHMPPEDMLALAKTASQDLPELPEFYAEQGLIFKTMGRMEEAEALLKKAVDVYAEHPVNLREASYFDDKTLVIVYRQLGQICHLQGKDDMAETYFRRARFVALQSESAGQVKWARGKNGKDKPYLSACYIVRDEADHLARSLESIRDEADELIVVDTGSTDATIPLARAYDARVLSFSWTDDFSAARNFALEQARGEWVLFLDADEYFAETTGGRLRTMLEQNEHVDQFLLFWRNIDEDTGEILLDSYAPRLFRNRADFRYVGRIHEELRQNGELIRAVATVPEDLSILMHTGYSGSVNRKKAERNLALLLEELKTSKHPEYLYMYLAEAYDGVGDEEEAIRYAEKDIATGKKPVVYASRSHRVLLRLLAKRPEETERRMQAAVWAVRDFPEVPEFHAEYAECLAQHRRFREALEELDRTEEALKKPVGLEPCMFPKEMIPMLGERRKLLASYLQEETNPRGACVDTNDIPMEPVHLSDGDLLRLLELLFLLERDEEEKAPALYASCKELLPPDLRQIWEAYEQGGSPRTDGYETILSVAALYADDSQLLRYAELSNGMAADQIYAVGNRLFEGERWQAAFSVYAMIPGDADCIGAEFWYRTGRCLYHLGEWDGAEECLTKALESQPEHLPARSFLEWTREAKS